MAQESERIFPILFNGLDHSVNLNIKQYVAINETTEYMSDITVLSSAPTNPFSRADVRCLKSPVQFQLACETINTCMFQRISQMTNQGDNSVALIKTS
ncbi:glutathione peroxidase [Sesbania bispinosa]|nr:glutathione peroxidase [Sesbania bispinosa]